LPESSQDLALAIETLMSAAIGSDAAGMSDDVALSDDTSPPPLLTTTPHKAGHDDEM
jgi:hypothetical protein